MCEIHIMHIPRATFCSIFRHIAGHTVPEKREFEAEAMAICGFQVASVIPPLRLKLGMAEMVTRKYVAIPWKSRSVLRGERLQKQKSNEQAGNATQHYSSWTTSRGFKPTATFAGYIPAPTVATYTRLIAPKSIATGQ